jgi:2-phospho-L-lactate transferase/gluconeogenesis factor (CofD/UPF0052 family)
MWLTKFLDIISRILPINPISGIEEALADLNPEKIYIENVRSLLGVSYRKALEICETAVRQGFFKRGIEVQCPDGAVAASVESEAELPETVNCLMEENGEYEEVEYPVNKLHKITFYRLDEQRATGLYKRTA